jgi:hypothetical protein
MKRFKNFYTLLAVTSLMAILPLLAVSERPVAAADVALTIGNSGNMMAETATVSARNDKPDVPRRAVYLKQGDKITITAEEDDTWSLGPTADRECNADGCQKFGDYRGFKYGALIGRIGESSSWFLVGTSYTATVQKTGYLYLACHDFPYDDNRGTIIVTVKVNQ